MIDQEAILNYMEHVDIERRNRWIACASKLEVIDVLLNATFQGIATIDSRLVKEDEKLLSNTPISNPFGDLSEHLTQSYLWILGAYEIIRTLSQYADSTSSNEFTTRKEDIRNLKHEFEKIRIPLAKFEASRRNPDGYPFAYPIVHKQEGTAWLIGKETYITRLFLSNQFLELMESLP